ncbi:MAG: hypothetical protein IJH55_07145, partial [Romboutsia sp.]|nr:hypothetical protein [Romboutsia sp.]
LMIDSLVRRQEESELEYKKRIYLYRDFYGLTWEDIADILNTQLGENYSSDKYRKESYKLLDDKLSQVIQVDDKLLEYKKEKVKLNDQRLQINALTRLAARDETFKEIALEVAKEISEVKFLDNPSKIDIVNKEKKAILCIGDWHYGLDVDLYYNEYNTEIAIQRISNLLNSTIAHLEEHNIDDLFIINLGDMISGRIHLPLRINNRIDTVQQTIEISEILAEFLTTLSTYTHVNYASVLDNHSRVEPNKKESLQTESFARIIDWFLQERLSSNKNIDFIDNIFSEDFAVFNVFNHCVVAVHGDKDPQRGIVDRLNSYLQGHIDLLISAHRHHFTADENNYTEFYCNGSLIGQDNYSADLRLNSKPSQLMFICTPENFSEIIYKIKL